MAIGYLRSIQRVFSAVVLGTGLLSAASPAAAQPLTVPLQPVKVSPHVYYFAGQAGMASAENKGFMSNAGFVVTGDGVVVFDALGTPALARGMIQAIREITPQPIKRVIVSHYHADHFYGLHAFKKLGAQIWAHEKGRRYLYSDIAQERFAQRKQELAPWMDNDMTLVHADRWLDFAQGKVMPFTMGDVHFKLIDVSGAHADDDIMLFVENDRILFAGDLFFTGRLPFVGDADSRAWLKALDSMLDVDPVLVIPGHGAASDTPRKDMQLTRNYLLFLREQLAQAVADFVPFEQAYEQIDWSAFKDYPAFDEANRPNAFGQYLQMEKESLGG